MIRILAIALSVALAVASPALAQLGPSSGWAPGIDCQPNTAGVDCIIQPAQMQPAYAAYQVAAPLNRVWAGDDPANPTQTVELQFPDEATAEAVLAAYWTP